MDAVCRVLVAAGTMLGLMTCQGANAWRMDPAEQATTARFCGNQKAQHDSPEQPGNPDQISCRTGLLKVGGDRFIIAIKYAADDNFLHRDVYTPFGIKACYVHPDLLAKLRQLEEILSEKHLKLVMFDCYRPIEVQRAMWKLVPDTRYVADPAKGSLHNRGIAVDVGLADEEGRLLPFPTAFDAFDRKAWANYICPAAEKAACDNRELLKGLMRSVGIDGITSEWWHFQLKDARNYPIVPLTAGGSTQ